MGGQGEVWVGGVGYGIHVCEDLILLGKEWAREGSKGRRDV
jgi:hypothetical protein